MKEVIIDPANKVTASYVVKCLEFLYSGEQVVIKARGDFIRTAVDVSQLVLKANKNAKITNIEIGTDKIIKPSGREKDISYIHIFIVNRDVVRVYN